MTLHNTTRLARRSAILAALAPAILSSAIARAEQPPPPCHPNPDAAADRAAIASRQDVVQLPQPLQERLIRMADRPHTFLAMQAFGEADKRSRLFQYYLLDSTGFEPNVFTARSPGSQRPGAVDGHGQ